MNKSVTIVFVLFLLIPISCFSQQKATQEVIDSIRIKYCFDKKYKDSLQNIRYMENSVPPPPPLTNAERKNFYADYSCKKRFKIPKEELLRLYPFDADSIVLFIPDDCYWQKGGEKRIGKMTMKLTAQFTDILYNYGFKKIDGEHISVHSVLGCGLPVPDIRMYFYYKDESKYFDIFGGGFVDSFANKNPYENYGSDSVFYEAENGIYWGGECDETYQEIIRFVERNFKCKLKIDRYECSNSCNEADLMDLKEFEIDNVE